MKNNVTKHNETGCSENIKNTRRNLDKTSSRHCLFANCRICRIPSV